MVKGPYIVKAVCVGGGFTLQEIPWDNGEPPMRLGRGGGLGHQNEPGCKESGHEEDGALQSVSLEENEALVVYVKYH